MKMFPPLVALALLLVACGSTKPDTALYDRVALTDRLIWIRPDTEIGNQSSLLFTTDDAVLLVDANIDVMAPSISELLEQALQGQPLYVVTSHHHGDHAQGLEYLPDSAIVMAPEQQRERLRTTPLTTPDSAPLQAGFLPAMTFEKAITLRMGGETVEILTPPNRSGHTDGDALVYFREAGVLYVGDYYFADRLPLIDFEGGGSIDGYLANLKWIRANYPLTALIIPGHGLFRPEPARVDTLTEFSAWVENLTLAVATLDASIAKGETVEQAVETGLPASVKFMGEKPRYTSEEKWIRMMFPRRVEERSRQ